MVILPSRGLRRSSRTCPTWFCGLCMILQYYGVAPAILSVKPVHRHSCKTTFICHCAGPWMLAARISKGAAANTQPWPVSLHTGQHKAAITHSCLSQIASQGHRIPTSTKSRRCQCRGADRSVAADDRSCNTLRTFQGGFWAGGGKTGTENWPFDYSVLACSLC